MERFKSMTKLLLCGLCLCILFSGCDSFLMSIDNVITPPKINEEQNAVSKAFTDQIGTGVQLKYPRSGSYRSAYVFYDIDGDGEEEAIVFYQTLLQSNLTSNVRVNIMDRQKDGSWVSACDIAGEGNEVDCVAFGYFKEDSTVRLVIGYLNSETGTKTFRIYRYAQGMLYGICSYQYKIFSLLGSASSDTDSLVFINSAADGSGADTANCLIYNDDRFFVSSSVKMYPGIVKYEEVLSGKLSSGVPALFIDGDAKKGQYGTQILTISGNTIENQTYHDSVDLVTPMLRNIKIESADIDGDGFCEVPTLSLVPGSTGKETQPLYYTSWVSYDAGQYTVKETSFISISDGYHFKVPGEWLTGVTAQAVPDQKEIRFYECRENGTQGEELLRIKTIQKSDTSQVLFEQGYFLIASVGQISYYGKVGGNLESKYYLNKEEVKERFSTML